MARNLNYVPSEEFWDREDPIPVSVRAIANLKTLGYDVTSPHLAVSKYQQDWGLHPTGKLDIQTQDMILNTGINDVSNVIVRGC